MGDEVAVYDTKLKGYLQRGWVKNVEGRNRNIVTVEYAGHDK